MWFHNEQKTPLAFNESVRSSRGTIVVNVTRLERGFNACKTPRCIYPSIFNRFPVIQAWSLKIRHFSTFLHMLASPVYAPETIAVNVTLLERGFNACKTPRCIYPSIFNRFPVIQAGILKIRRFGTFFAYFGLPWVRPWDNRGKCYMDWKRIQCLSNASQNVSIYLRPFLRYSELLVENCEIFTLHLCLAAPPGWPRRNYTQN